jgi:hypothetical protein
MTAREGLHTRPKLADKEISQDLEDRLLGLVDHLDREYPDAQYWYQISCLALECDKRGLGPTLSRAGQERRNLGIHTVSSGMTPELVISKSAKPGAPTKLDRGARDLLIYLEMIRAENEGKSIREAARNLEYLWRRDNLSKDSWKTIRQRYYTLRRRQAEPSDSMLRAADSLSRSKAAGR